MKSITNKETLEPLIVPELDFISELECMVKSGAGYIECILELCNRRGLEQEQVIPLIKKNKSIHSKLTEEATVLNCLKKRKSRKRKNGR